MKKETLIIIAAIVIVFILMANNSSSESEQDPYVQGQQYAVSQIRYAADSDNLTRYVDIEMLEDIIRDYFGHSADEVRDMLIYDPDLKHYYASDIVNDIIDNDCSFDF